MNTTWPNYMDAARRTMQAGGVEFTNGDAPSVRLKKAAP